MDSMLVTLMKTVYTGMTIGAFFCWLAAKILKVPEATFVKAFLVMLPISLLSHFSTHLRIGLSFSPVIILWGVEAALTVVILKWIYKTVWGKAALVWLIGFFIPNLLFLGLLFLGLGALFSMA